MAAVDALYTLLVAEIVTLSGLRVMSALAMGAPTVERT